MASAIDYWLGHLGDRTVADWIIVAVYAAATIAAFRLLLRSRRPGAMTRRARLAWLGLALGLLALGINKQLDFQTLLTSVLRSAARDGGWYDQRKGMQSLFVMVNIGLAFVASGLCIWLLRRERWTLKLALLGAMVQLAFIGTRLISFHDTDHLLSDSMAGQALKWRHAMELGGLVIMLTAILLESRFVCRGGGKPATARKRGRRAEAESQYRSGKSAFFS